MSSIVSLSRFGPRPTSHGSGLGKVGWLLPLAILLLAPGATAEEPPETVEFQDLLVTDIDRLRIHNSPLPPSGDWWIKIGGRRITNKRVSIYLWKGNPRRRAAISGRADGEGVWSWRQRPASQGYAPFDLENGDKIHLICRNGDELRKCYRIVEIRTDEDGIVKYFRGVEVPCD